MDNGSGSTSQDEEVLWSGLDSIVCTPCQTHEHIDDVLRDYLGTVTKHKSLFFRRRYDVEQCAYKLLDSELFKTNQEYARRQLLYCLLQDDDADNVHLAAAICLYDGRSDENLFEIMQAEGAFVRLVELVSEKPDDDDELHRLLLELLFEMARIQTLERDELASVSDGFILSLFKLIESLSNDADDPYHYPVIRVLLVLNEQYMCYASTSDTATSTPGLTNRVLKLLSTHGALYRTFGENIILLLNRESALGAQLLILKLLYLLFTTSSTYEYFYTNDLHVLVDVIMRNLLDLDTTYTEASPAAPFDGHNALRHTYLRVLCPLLKNTQLSRVGNHYKRHELRRLMNLLINRSSAHFAPVDETVIRLVIRCKQIDWLQEDTDAEDDLIERKLAETEPDSATVANRLLGISLDAACDSSLSVMDVSAKITKQKPSLPAPRRKRGTRPTASGAQRSTMDTQLNVPTMASSVSHALPAKPRSPFADSGEEEWK